MFAGWFRIVAAYGFVLLTAVSVAAEPPLLRHSLARLEHTPPQCPDSFDFIVVGDSNTLKPLEQSSVFRQMIREFNLLKPNLVIEVGDIVLGGAAEGVPAQWDLFQTLIRTCQPPYLAVPGNHDISDAATERIWLQRMGPTHYAFSYGNSFFLMLNSEEVGAVERISDEQAAWARKQLQSTQAKNVFVFLHQPYFEHMGDPDDAAAYRQKHWSNMADVFRGHPVKVVFSGHEHVYRDCGTRDGIRYVITGGAATYGITNDQAEGSFNHYLLVRVRGADVSWTLIKPGAILPADAATTARIDELYNVRNKWVRGEELVVPLGASVDRDVHVTVTNPQDSAMKSSLTWESPPGWTVHPREATYEVPGKASTALTFHVRTDSRAAARFPVPSFRTHYSQTQHGPPVDVAQDLKLVPTLPAIRANRPLRIDGALDEWKDAPMMPLTYPVGFSGDPGDLASKVGFQWDDAHLYMAVVTRDNDFDQPYAGDIVWSADAVEMFLDDWSWGLSLTSHGPEVFCYYGVDVSAETVNTDVKLAVKRDGTQIVYEAAFPKPLIAPLKLAPGNSFRFNMLMNDLDTSGPVKLRHWLQLVPEHGSPGNPGPRVKVVLEPSPSA